MLLLASKNLFQEKTRLVMSVGGVAFSVLLMIVLQGLSVGYSNVLGQYFSNVPADIWVAKANSGNIMDPSFVPLSAGPKLKNIDGVASAEPFGMQSLTTDVRGKDLQFYLIAYDPASPVGKPSSVSEGASTPGVGEIIIDRVTAKSNKVEIGDSLKFGGNSLRVVGFSEGTYLLSSSFAFINVGDTAGIYGLPESTNYWVIKLKPGSDTAAVQADIERSIPGVSTHTKSHFIQVNIDVVKGIVQPVFGALVILGALIGTVVIGLTIFTATIEKSKEYGVLKAIGLNNRQLYTIVFEQALSATIIGFLVGAALAYALNPIITNLVPQFVTQLRLADMAWIFAVTIGMAVVSSYIPMRRLGNIDPAEVFRS